MLQRIMVPTDGSAESEKALAIAQEVAKAQGAEVRLVRVAEDLAWVAARGEFSASPEILEELLEKSEADARANLAGLVDRLAANGVRASSLIVRGSPAGALLDCVEEEHPDLVAMATHGRTGLARFTLGSVTDRVVREGQAPVLVIRRSSEPTHKLESAVLMLDGSGVAEETLPMVHELARKPLMHVKLLRVVSDPSDRGAAHNYLEGAAARLAADGLDTELVVDVGSPEPIIERLALEADFVILCTHGRSGIDRLRHGSVAEHVIHEVDCPVLLVRARAQ